jgi:hypothetical protein
MRSHPPAHAWLAILGTFVLAAFLHSCSAGKAKSNLKTNPATSTGTGGSTNTGTTSTGTGGSPGNGVPLDFNWGTSFNASQAWMESKADEMKTDYAPGLWKATEGQMYLCNQTFTNGDSNARFLFQNADSWTIPGYPAIGRCDIQVTPFRLYFAGMAWGDVFLHEFCHGEFVKHTEEYNCSICIMGKFKVGNITKKWHYCDESDCMANSYCWPYILKQYSDWVHTGKDPGSSPVCQVTIE